MESILPVEQLMILSTFLMLLLENWFTPFKVIYALFLKACDTEPFAFLLSHYLQCVMWIKREFLYAVRMSANGTVFLSMVLYA